MYYTVIKHDRHLRTLEKCRKHSPPARAFYISLVFSNACRILSQCNTRLRLLYLLNHKFEDICYFKLQVMLKMTNATGYLQIAKEHESRCINRKSNLVQFTNRIPPSLKLINHDSLSKVKLLLVIHKSLNSQKCVF